ncbi:DUF397 domain-containing protein [Streptomyces nanshensis]|uniref:DUF397 domain-containing protein n=1 Tax=Streptomyces nanshensis TaxID=518642 RepID=A0A1E7LA29_9ACTN|nr:DUF397 domain-containing protein [Streptomyces nanshensis]OEV13014.1 hypothetical protein AN218_05775 [Streptomyces nanshensis]
MAEEASWHKSSYSNDQGGSCVEIANLTDQVGVRDSKDKTGPALVVPASTWSAFIAYVQERRLDATN